MGMDRYPRYAEVCDWIAQAVREYPEHCASAVIGQSPEGRPIWAVTLSSGGSAEQKPAVLVEAAMHAGEIVAVPAALATVRALLEEGRSLLEETTFYVIPCVTPDGYEATLTEPVFLRSSPLQYPEAEPPEGLQFADIDGDGCIRWMRQRHPAGPWKASALDPRIMIRRQPEDRVGEFYHCYPEGRLKLPAGREPQGVGALKYNTRLDFNRNFPQGWQPEARQAGAGRYPLDRPETRALAEFVLAHKNINIYLALHGYGGVLLRPPGNGGDETLNPADLRALEAVGDLCQRVTGYPCKSSNFAYAMAPGKPAGQGAKDWAYEHLGLIAYTLELWDPDSRAGARSYRDVGMRGLARLTEAEREADERKRLEWQDRELGGAGFRPWTPCEHPQLGPVEIGGWDMTFALGNPPRKFLPDECRKVSAFVRQLGLTLPRLAIGTVRTQPLEGGAWRVEAEVLNTGFLATSSTRTGAEMKAAGPVEATLNLPDGAALLAGRATQDLGHLDGYGAAQATPFGGGAPGAVRNTAWAEWVVAVPAGAELRVRVAAPRAGWAEAAITLGKKREAPGPAW